MKKLISTLCLSSLLLGSAGNVENIKLFLDARYSGDDTTIFTMISEDFNYYQTPYIGLGIDVDYNDGDLIVTGFFQDSLRNDIQIGDRIHELNGEKVFDTGLLIYGAAGELQQLIVTKLGDSTFSEIHIPLIKIQSSQNHDEFLESIISYNTIWHDYHIEIEEIISDKNKISVLYHWEGSKEPEGKVYHFSAMEFIYFDKKTDLITRIEGLWSEKQFRDQFK